jgi:hypothetical protein
MRRAVLALLFTTACVPPRAMTADPTEDPVAPRRAAPDLEAARELDQEGVRAFRDARYADAIRFFRAAYRLGAPSSELWNIARSRERMDDPEAAAGAIEQYLAQRDVSGQDRTEAERELGALRARPSVLTVTTVPSGAFVTVDGHPAPGVTPVSVEVRAGAHTLSVRRDGYVTETRPLEARFGRAVIVSLDLAKARGGSQ